ncbi:MAG: branched-chain amino acid transport system ATP-binding protein [Fusobacteriaceae bacterium]|jgi:branched-chain amino acid transport system ATP-binding protein|nr:amino acid/amide transporter ATP-binding protein 2, family [Fusobacteriales bacterium]MDN5303573.1 branched-chain amino acid transport system ATP-binding protein [Fusobacteriaceae bacterium]
MLKIENLNVHYGNIHAIKDLNIEINKGEIICLIGANGAGKTSTLHSISKLINPSGGKMYFEGEDITNLSTTEIVKRGLIQVPEGRRVFANLTVLENLELGAYLKTNKKEVERDMERVFNRFPRLYERKAQLAGTLSGGEQQMLAMGRALMSSPKLLLLDEPSMGLAPLLIQEVFDIIQEINKEMGITILLVEQNANMALKISDRAYILETGNIMKSGNAQELLHDEAVREAYLG